MFFPSPASLSGLPQLFHSCQTGAGGNALCFPSYFGLCYHKIYLFEKTACPVFHIFN